MVNNDSIFQQGQLLLIDKPLYWTSFDVVKKIRYLTKTKKVGHAGTLDPLATGLLIVCTGKFTKKISEYMALQKEYTGTITLGATTPTYDLESVPENFKPVESLNSVELYEATKDFTGTILQTPPAHSAIKKDGKRAYELARTGVETNLKSREVTITEFLIIKVEIPNIDFKVVCSTGTYIRSLANDFGQKLGCGGYLSSLRRTRIGSFSVSNAQSIQEVEDEIKAKTDK
jgi:tRNA pseudouridine55 synthase